MRKKILVALLVMLALIVAGCGTNGGTSDGDSTAPSNGSSNETDTAEETESPESYRIAISQYVEHPSLDATREGFLDALKDAGLEEGTNLTIDYNNAQADSTNNLSIAQKIASEKNDLVLAIATPSAQAVVEQVEDTPVVFAAVTDPLDAKLVDDLDAPGGNVTGAADTNPDAILQLMNFIADHFPEVETVGIVINEGEPNAVIMAEHAEKALADLGLDAVRATVTNTSEVRQAAESLIGRADAIYITLDNSVVSGVDAIIDVAYENQIPFFSSDRDTVENGAFATVGFKYYDHGYQAGEMAVQILKEGKHPGEMPVTFPVKLDFIMNLSAAKEMGIEVTDDMLNMVKDQENNLIE